MTTSDVRPVPAGQVDRLAAVRTLSDQLPRFMRLAHAVRSQMAAGGDRDRAALVLLFPLERLGPLRQGALAELVHADPSTVSRHVAQLVERGLVRRVADESDGRASRLVVTDAGSAALRVLRRERESHLEHVTAGWSAADLATFTALFGRLLDDLATTLPGVPDAVPHDGTAPTDLPRETR
jgi:DNA-binding MarR family transcriptional regulator